MGGYGSGRRVQKKRTVESCKSLDTKQLLDYGVLKDHGGAWAYGSLSWTLGGETTGNVSYYANVAEKVFRLVYTVNGTPVDYRVTLRSTPVHFGGERWWFACPTCGRRVRKLYLAKPPYFECRQCNGLTYHSAQTHDGRLDFFLKHPEAALAAFHHGNNAKRYLAMRAVLKATT